MNVQEMVIFNRLTGFGVNEVTATPGESRESMVGTEVTVRKGENEYDFFFPDYAGMNDEEIGEVIANNLREELWNSLNK